MESIVLDGDLNQVQMLIQRGVDVNQWTGGASLLGLAIKQGYQDIALALLAAGADVHVKDQSGWSALHWACLMGLNEVVRALIDGRSRLNEQERLGRTPLMLAVEYQNITIAMCLLRAGASCEGLSKAQVDDLSIHAYSDDNVLVVEAPPMNSFSTSVLPKEDPLKLHIACYKNDVTVVKSILFDGCNVNHIDANGCTPIIVAVREGYKKIVLVLLEAGADVQAKDGDQRTVLHWACLKGLEEVVQVLIDQGSRMNELDRYGHTPLKLAEKGGNRSISENLLRAGVSCHGLTDGQMNDLYEHAFHEGDLLAIQNILKNGCKISTDQQECLLHRACREGDTFVVESLLTAGCNVKCIGADGCTPIIAAARNGHKGAVLALLEAGADVHVKDEDKRSVLHWACLKGLEEVVQALIKRGSPMNGKDRYGCTPLALCGNTKIWIYVLRAGASCDGLSHGQMNDLFQHAFYEGDLLAIQTLFKNDYKLSTEQQEKLLYMACHEGDAFVVEAVIANGCNVNYVDADGFTPLMVATQNGKEEAVKKLILAGADVGMQSAQGNTALHIAALRNHIQCGILLAEGGASISTKNKLSQTPLDVASKHVTGTIVQTLSFTTRKALCIIGNAENGKSTLIAALQAESNSVLSKMVNRFKKVSDRRQRTAGIEIIPHFSQGYGEVLFFDFAGQHEYHGPHQMFLESLLCKPGVSMTLLLVVKMIEEEETILHQVHRWLSPVALMSTTASPPQVIIIGSFLDKVKSKREAIAKLTRCLDATKRDLQELPLKFIGTCYLNCRQPLSEGIDQLCTFLQEVPIPEFRATHTQYSLAWVLYQIRSSFEVPAVQLQEYSTWIQENKDNLPRTMPPPEEVCRDLSAAGHALYLPNMEDPPKSWLVLDIPSILQDVYGTLFSQYKGIVNEFGLLHCQHLAKLFPHLDLEFVQQLLISLEFCLPVDPSVLKVEVSRLTQSEETSGWLFFPALISAKPPQPTLEGLHQQNVRYLCWQLRTSQKHSISARLLQTILLRLAAHFVVKQLDEEGVQQHCCSIWWNGIAWQTRKGVDVTVHITNNRVIQVDSTSVLSADKSCQYLKDVISDILSTVRRLSPKLAAGVYIVHPPIIAVSSVNITAPPPTELFPVEGVRSSIRDCEEYCFSLKDGYNPSTRVVVTDLFGGYAPSLEDIERIGWTQPHSNQPRSQSLTGPNQPRSQSLTEPNQLELSQTDVLLVYTCEGYLILFRKYVSRKSAGKGRAVLEGVGLTPETIAACYGRHPFNEEEAVQDGLIKWAEGHHDNHPTWRVLLDAMVYAGVAQQQCQGLREELYQMLIKMPTKIYQAQSSAEPSQPESSAEPSQSQSSAEPSQSQSLAEPSQPQSSAEPSQLRSSGEQSQPESSAEPNQPQLSAESSQPQSSTESRQPQSSAGRSLPQSSVEPSQPQSPAESSQPQSSTESRQPQSSAGRSQPQSSVEPSQPQSSAELNQPQSSGEPSQPQLSVKQLQGAQALLDVSSTPDMSDVDELVVTAVAANWQWVALGLKVADRVRRNVVFNHHPNDCEGACHDMFDRWLRGEQHAREEERTWSTILTALSRAGFEELVKDLRREHFKTE